MPRFHFNITKPEDYTADPEGLDLPDLEAVQAEAELGARCLLSDGLKFNRPLDLDATFHVTDERGSIVHTLAFSEVLRAASAGRWPS